MEPLTDQNIYSSPKKHISGIAKHFPGLVFYLKMFSVVIRSSHMAKKGVYNNEAWVNESKKTLKALESVGMHFLVENLSILRSLDRPCVFIGNHMSVLETFVLPSLIQPYKDVTFVVKESLIRYPIFKHVMISRNPIVVTREDPRADLKAVLKGGLERLKRNISIIVFPQTTRTLGLNREQFNSIGIKLAKGANVPVVPLALKTDGWGNGHLIKDFGKIDPSKSAHFCFGDPLLISQSGREEHEFIFQFIQSKLNSWYNQ